MGQKFTVPVSIKQLGSAGSEAITVYVNADTYARLKVDAGGKLTWGSGSATGDTTLYRSAADTLKTDDSFEATGSVTATGKISTSSYLESTASAGDEGGEIQLAKPATNSSISGNVVVDIYQNKLRFFESTGTNRGAYIDLTAASAGVASNLLTGGGGGATTLDGLTDVTAPSPTSGDFLKYNGSAWVNDPIDLSTDTVGNYVASLVAGTNITLANNSGEGATPTVTVSGALTSIDSVSSPDFIQFDTSVGSPASVEGKLQWDSDFGTLSFGLEGNNSVQQLGMNQFAYCYNAEATTLNKGEAVYIFGGQGSQVSIKRALNTGDATSATTLGIVAESIASAASGYVCTYGVLQGINTTAFNEGDILYLGSTAGTLTATKPSAPNHYVFVAVVIKAAVGGELWVRPQNGFELNEIHNVSLTSEASGDFLKYNGTLWVNDPINLGTDTVGNYMVDVSAGTGVSVTHTQSEGSTATIAIGQAVATTDSPTFAGLTINGASVVFEGATADAFETTLTVTDPTADRTITLPDASGTVGLLGSIALGTDTTGNYMSGVSAGTGVTVTHTPGEGSTATIAIGQAVGTADSPSFAAITASTGNITATLGNLVGSNLVVTNSIAGAYYFVALGNDSITYDDTNDIFQFNSDGGTANGTLGCSSIKFANNDTITYDDTGNIFSFNSDGSTGNGGIDCGDVTASAITSADKFLRDGNISAASWTTAGVAFQSAASTFTDTSAGGTVATAVANSFNRPTFAASNARTITSAATVYIANSPLAGTNVTQTNTYALWVDAGVTRLDGDIDYGGSIYNTSTSNYIEIGSDQSTGIGQNTTTDIGVRLSGSGAIWASRNNGTLLVLNRMQHTAGGTLAEFRTNGAAKGTITENAGTVSYNAFLGSHYTEIDGTPPLRGTVMESTGVLVDGWLSDQSRLPKCKVSDTVGSTAVFGIYFGEHIEDETVNGHLVASIGAAWVRMASGSTPSLGDLIESNGDGCARIQEDTIIRSSTIGKLSSTTPAEVYEDGSYLLPCVLYCG